MNKTVILYMSELESTPALVYDAYGKIATWSDIDAAKDWLDETPTHAANSASIVTIVDMWKGERMQIHQPPGIKAQWLAKIAANQMANWPDWKKNLLQNASAATTPVARKPVVTSDDCY